MSNDDQERVPLPLDIEEQYIREKERQYKQALEDFQQETENVQLSTESVVESLDDSADVSSKWLILLILTIITLVSVAIFIAIVAYAVYQQDGNEIVEITIVNHLFLPVDIYFDNEFQTQIGATETRLLPGVSFPIEVEFNVVRRIREEDEFMFGDEMSGKWPRIDRNTILEIDNVIAESTFFYPQLSNNTDWDCDIIIDHGYEREKRIGTLEANAQGIVAGYYRYYPDSNVLLDCDELGGRYWGVHPEYGGDKTFFIQEKTGFVEFVLNQ